MEIKSNGREDTRKSCTYTKIRPSRTVSRDPQLTVNKTIMKPELTHGPETWSLTAQDAESLCRKVIRRIT